MILYHGTWEDSKDRILETGYIDCNASGYSYEDTEIIDNLFEEHLGYNPRNMCIYLSNDCDTVEAYDYAFKVDAEELNTKLLYVGDNSIVQNMYVEINKANVNKDRVKSLIKAYEDSLVEFEIYEKENNKIDYRLEFLYFGHIEVTEGNLY